MQPSIREAKTGCEPKESQPEHPLSHGSFGTKQTGGHERSVANVLVDEGDGLMGREKGEAQVRACMWQNRKYGQSRG